MSLAFFLLLAACGRTVPDAEGQPMDPGMGGMEMNEHAGHGGAPAAPAAPMVSVAPADAAALGIQVVAARAGGAETSRRAPASVQFDPTRTARVTVQPGGQVRRLSVPRVGERVRKGQVLAQVYQPEIVAGFQDLLIARGLGEAYLADARARLVASGVDDREVEAALASGKAPPTFAVRAPIDGIVTARPAAEGAWLAPGGVLAGIADPNARLAEMVVSGAAPTKGTVVTVSDAATGDRWEAQVAEVLPSAEASGLAIRLTVSGGPPVGRPLVASWTEPAGEGVWVPRGAVVDTGERAVVFVATPDGMYSPRTVRTGVRTKDEIAVVEGLSAGEQVVAAGTFFLDADTQMSPGGGHSGHAGHGG